MKNLMKTNLPLILLLFCSMFIAVTEAGAQTKGKPATGIVVDSKGEPLTGVTVLLKATTIGTTTDVKGRFSLETGSEGRAVLVFSYIGFETKEVATASAEEIRVILVESNIQLNEVVVVGYGTQRKRDLTGSVSSVNTKELKTLPVPSIGDALQGRSAGVQVLSSGAPGSNVTLRIRGAGTINNSDPLLVIDGVPTNIPLNTISPDDIASIEILKDASAAAIYGSRGANGVLLITTKKGTQEKNTLEFKMFTGVQTASNKVDMLNASDFAGLHNDMMTNNGQALNPDYADPSSFGAGTNWLDAIFRSAPIQNYSLAYSGGNAKSNYYVSGAILNQEGIIINTGYKRYTVQFNSDSKVFEWLKFSNNLTLNHDIKTSGDYNIRNTMAALPTQSIYNADGTYSGPVGQSSWVGDLINPIGKAKMVENSTKGYNAIGNISAEISILKELKF
ncbi:MAG: SusC/RagA family TonB-linked outer membrane protein, partial [Bacteroidetes bacterium HGW-Bacteroidetes-11]